MASSIANTPQKMKFPIKHFFSKWPNPQETADVVTFTEEILNEKFLILCSSTTSCKGVIITIVMTTSSFKFQNISFSVNFIKIVFPNKWYAKELFWENSEYSWENIGGALL